jgi:hypothetical protein
MSQIKAMQLALDALNKELVAEKLYSKQAMQAVDEITAERNALALGVARYRWLVANAEKWSYQPGRYSCGTVSGFSANGTGYLGYTFEQGLGLAMQRAFK